MLKRTREDTRTKGSCTRCHIFESCTFSRYAREHWASCLGLNPLIRGRSDMKLDRFLRRCFVRKSVLFSSVYGSATLRLLRSRAVLLKSTHDCRFGRTQIARPSVLFVSTTRTIHYISALVAAIVLALLNTSPASCLTIEVSVSSEP